jgi:Tfp pilus assembly protein PilX
MKRTYGAESGIALIVALLVLLLLSIMAAGVMFTTQAEIWTTSNYRFTTQARYAAEAGAHQTVSWLSNTWQPSADAATDIGAMTIDSIPVKLSGQPAVLGSGTTAPAANWPGTASAASFASTNSIQLPGVNGIAGATVTNSAQLLEATYYPDVTSGLKYTTKWKVTSLGKVTNPGGNPISVQVVAIVESSIFAYPGGGVPKWAFGVMATGTGCGASGNGVIQMAGGQYTGSYSSSANAGATSPPITLSGGDIGSMGTVKLTNGAYIYGNLASAIVANGVVGGPGSGKSTPACNTTTPQAAIEDNSGSVITNNQPKTSAPNTAGAIPDDQKTHPDPLMPSVAANTSACSAFNGICNGGSGYYDATLKQFISAITLPPNPTSNYGVASFGGSVTITLQPGTYNFDTLTVANGSKFILPTTGIVNINILNASNSSTPLTWNGGTMVNGGGDPNNLTFIYAGTKTINVNAGTNVFGTIYAPNASLIVDGNAGLFGAVVANNIKFQGSGHVIYDTDLKNKVPNVPVQGASTKKVTPMHIDEFSWSAF